MKRFEKKLKFMHLRCELEVNNLNELIVSMKKDKVKMNTPISLIENYRDSLIDTMYIIECICKMEGISL